MKSDQVKTKEKMNQEKGAREKGSNKRERKSATECNHIDRRRR